VNGFFAKLARFAVSKGAAFSYAVAVGVAGNLVFHFVQWQVPIPSVLTGAPEASQIGDKPSGGPAATATIAPRPAVAPIPEPAGATPSAAVSTPTAPPVSKPTPALQLPERSTASLPHPTSLPSPSWKPQQLPNAPAAGEATAKPAPTPSTSAAAPIDAPSAGVSNPVSPPIATLPPLGPAIDVATPPMPPERVPAPAVVALAPPPPVTAPPPQHSLELSDLWHPYRAVKKGLNWAGDQLPVIGADSGDAAPPATPPRELPPTAIPAAASLHATTVAKPAAPAEPIPLLPTKATPELADKPPPGKPGPGSGGLY
jgi:hypothetical protein